MRSDQGTPTIVNRFLAAALALVLGASLIATPQALSWLCPWSCAGIGVQAMPQNEEEVKEESARLTERGVELLPAPIGHEAMVLPRPTDDAALPTRYAQVAERPPEAC